MNFNDIKKWKLKESSKWKPDGTNPLKLGDQTIEFKEIDGYLKPDDKIISISEELHEKIIYEPIPKYNLKVNIYAEDLEKYTLTVLPVIADIDALLLTCILNTFYGKWKVVGYSDWKSSYESIYLLKDKTYTIQFMDIANCVTPMNQNVTMNNPKTIYGNYSAIQPKYKIRYDLSIEDPDSPQSNGQYIPPTYLYQIEALKSFSTSNGIVEIGDVGGYIKNETCLSQLDNCWIFDGSMCYGNAKILDDAIVYLESNVCGDSQITGNVEILQGVYIKDSQINGNAKIQGSSRITNYSKISENAYIYEATNVYKSEIFGSVKVHGGSNIHEGSKIYGNAEITDSSNCYGVEIYGNAKIHGSSNIYDAKIFDYADITDSSTISGNIKIYGNAKVYGGSGVYDKVEIYGNAKVYNGSNVYNTSKVYENAQVYNGSNIYGNSLIHGNAEIVTENVSNEERI